VALTKVGLTLPSSYPHTTMPGATASIGTGPVGVSIMVPAGKHSATGHDAASAVASGLSWMERQALTRSPSTSFTVSE